MLDIILIHNLHISYFRLHVVQVLEIAGQCSFVQIAGGEMPGSRAMRRARCDAVV
jgi:hypothetical protein